MKPNGPLAALVLVTILSLACAAGPSGRVYSPREARLPMTVQRGVVDSVRAVTIEGTPSGFGGFAGMVAGATAGSAVGGGSGRAMATVAGAILGSLAGNAMERDGARYPALEIIVRLESGVTYAIVQAQAPGETFTPGQPVEVLTAQDGTMRVRPR